MSSLANARDDEKSYFSTGANFKLHKKNNIKIGIIKRNKVTY